MFNNIQQQACSNHIFRNEIQKYTLIELMLLLIIILLNSQYGVFLALIILIIFQSKKLRIGANCLIKRDLTGKIAIVTGGNSGMGKETVFQLAQNGCQVVIAARDQFKSQNLIKEIQQKIPNAKVHSIFLDLASKKQIQLFVKTFKQKFCNVDYLINNAAVMMIPERKLTQDGFEFQMGINYLGHFYLTSKLWPILKKCEDLRIINVSSIAHNKIVEKVNLDFSDFNLKRSYQPMKAYCNSKLALTMFTQELASKLSKVSPKARCVCLHPGFVDTQIGRYIRKANNIISYTIKPVSMIFGKSPKQGCQTTLFTIMSQLSDLKNGQYYDNCEPGWKNPFALVQQNRTKLWQMSEELLNTKFNLEQ